MENSPKFPHQVDRAEVPRVPTELLLETAEETLRYFRDKNDPAYDGMCRAIENAVTVVRRYL